MSNVLKIRMSLTKNAYRTVSGTVSKAGNFAIKETTDASLDDESQSVGFKEHNLSPTSGKVTAMVLTAPDAELVDKVFTVPIVDLSKNLFKALKKERDARAEEGEGGSHEAPLDNDEDVLKSSHTSSDGSVEYSDEYPDGRKVEEDRRDSNGEDDTVRELPLILDPSTGEMIPDPNFVPQDYAEGDDEGGSSFAPYLIWNPETGRMEKNPVYRNEAGDVAGDEKPDEVS